jgi:Asp-tRNA(Asn)/Glu-tRNA(Gln) amidotransferase A subunit family amidase
MLRDRTDGTSAALLQRGRHQIESCRRAIREKNRRIRALLNVLKDPQRDADAKESAPLFGVPYVLKDCWDTAGIHTTGGSWRHRDRIPSQSGDLHRALARAGAVLLGKSNLSDLCFSPESDNHLLGATNNPFDASRTAGGSTGGGAAAIATGMAAFDWGGDFGGSIRIPSAACGVAGIRLSQAAWPGSMEQFPRLADHFASFMGYGPMARTVEGCREVMRAVRGDLRAAVGEERPRGRALVYAPDARCAGAWPTFAEDASRALALEGVAFETAHDIPPPSFVNDAFNGYLAAHLDEFASTGEIDEREAIAAAALALVSRGLFDQRIHPNTAILLALVKVGNLTLFRNKRRAAEKLARVRDAVKRAWSRGQLIVAPTTTLPPPRHGRAAFTWTWQAFAKLGNATDATAIAVPFGKLAGAHARSIQVLGPPGSEEAVLDLAAKLERAGAH